MEDVSRGFTHAGELHAQSQVLRVLVECCRTLKRVAFTTEVEWEERDGVWHHSPMVNLMKYQEDDERYRDEDEQVLEMRTG